VSNFIKVWMEPTMKTALLRIGSECMKNKNH